MGMESLSAISGMRRQAIELPGLIVEQLCTEAFDRVVLPSKAVLVDQILAVIVEAVSVS